jgi:hypothetical protein
VQFCGYPVRLAAVVRGGVPGAAQHDEPGVRQDPAGLKSQRDWQTSIMAMPQLPSRPSRQLVQAVWELALGTLRWPTFAEWDRRLDSAYDVQALDALSEVPPGFLYGVGPNSPVPLPDSQEVGLTVAGVAACPNTSELLTMFVEFIQMATSVEKGWQPPPSQPDAKPSLSDTEFASRARMLPAAGRDHLLQLLLLILQTERGSWAGFTADPKTGHWAACFNREIRVFRNVTDIDDYWSRRFKPWENRSNASAPAAASASPSPPNEAELLGTHPELLADVLLQLIYDAVQPHCQPGLSDRPAVAVPRPQVAPALHPGVIQSALLLLESRGYIQPSLPAVGDTRGKSLAKVQLTVQGAAHVVQARSVMTNRIRRSQVTRDALLAWMYDQRAHPQGAVHVDNFFRGPQSAFNGQFFSLSDVDDAASYLQEKGLIAGTGVDRRRGPVIAQITANGIDCVEQGGSVSEYIKQPGKASVSYSFNGPVSGTNFAVGDNAMQHATANGMDAGGLRTVITAITDAFPILRMDAGDEKAAADAASEVISEMEKQIPNASRIGAAISKMRQLLARAGNQALAAALQAAIDYERTKLGLPPVG